MRYTIDSQQCNNFEVSSRKEWLLTNGLGGYAMGTVSGANMRRYHGHLVAATQPPTYRMVLLANVETFIQGQGNPIGVSCNQYSGTVYPEGYQYIQSFNVNKFARWHYRAGGMDLLKRLAIHEWDNSSTLSYKNIGGKPIQLSLRPLVCHKFYHENFFSNPNYPQVLEYPKNKIVIEHEGVPLILTHEGADYVPSIGWYYRFELNRELERGQDYRTDYFCPCELHYSLSPGQEVFLVASTSENVQPYQFDETEEDSSLGTALKEAASKFFVKCENRTTIIAGYPWFTDWGRDTMISLPGVLLHTGRVADAKKIILDFATQMKQGLIPNRFVDRGEEPEYNTVDGTLWFANAIYRTLNFDWDESFAKKCMDVLEQVYQWHQKGTFYGIKVDQSDGLLTQGVPGVQLTWMDAKVGDWVVTPRHGKAVEVNGLWINTLRIMEWLAEKVGRPNDDYRKAAEQAEKSFEPKFWRDTLGYYLDTADPDDATLRPNQLIAMSLPFAPAKGENAKKALQKVTQELLTPVGLKTLPSGAPGYKSHYKGTLPELDAAYHQGTVWPWLLGPYVSALVKLTGDVAEAKRILKPAKDWLVECGIGGITEVYDADEPRSAGGCPWQAWSVAEIHRAWVEDAGGK